MEGGEEGNLCGVMVIRPNTHSIALVFFSGRRRGKRMATELESYPFTKSRV